ncbi:MAG: response regulator [Candidatus Omnitrophica bacterium]|nr:response regulator [Candidatus Omnitrophota bacterium]
MKLEKLCPKHGGEMLSENKQIFIVDDDESVCRALSVLLVTYGFTVDVFTSAEEFFRVVPNSAAGCLILDIHMPGLDGMANAAASSSIRMQPSGNYYFRGKKWRA